MLTCLHVQGYEPSADTLLGAGVAEELDAAQPAATVSNRDAVSEKEGGASDGALVIGLSVGIAMLLACLC